MQNISFIIALIGTLVFLYSVAAWWKILPRHRLQPIAGRFEQNTRGANSAAIALVAAFGLCLMAAILAIFARVF